MHRFGGASRWQAGHRGTRALTGAARRIAARNKGYNVPVTAAAVLHFILIYGYWLILPLAVVEGPILTVLAGVLVGSGHLDWRWVLALVVIGDLIGDMLYYAVGRWSWGPLKRLGQRFGLTGHRATRLIERMDHGRVKVLLIGKWTHAIGALVLVAAGIVRMPVVQFLLVNLFATLPKSIVFLLIGIYAGQHLPSVSNALIYAPVVLLPVGIIAIVLLLRRSRSRSKHVTERTGS